MLAPAQKLFVVNEKAEMPLFSKYKRLATELCTYLKDHEAIDVQVFASPEEERDIERTFNGSSLQMQEAKLEAFLNYYNHCFELSARRISLLETRESLACFCSLQKLHFPYQEEVMALIEGDVFAEIYDLNFTQRYRSPGWLRTTSYSLMALETYDWRNLFFHSEAIKVNQLELVTAIYSGVITKPVHRPLNVHTVKELNSTRPLAAEVNPLVYAPVLNADNILTGGLHAFKVTDVHSIAFTVCKGSPN